MIIFKTKLHDFYSFNPLFIHIHAHRISCFSDNIHIHLPSKHKKSLCERGVVERAKGSGGDDDDNDDGDDDEDDEETPLQTTSDGLEDDVEIAGGRGGAVTGNGQTRRTFYYTPTSNASATIGLAIVNENNSVRCRESVDFIDNRILLANWKASLHMT